MDNDGYISNGELFQVLKMMVGSNLKDTQLQQVSTPWNFFCRVKPCVYIGEVNCENVQADAVVLLALATLVDVTQSVQ